MKFKIVFSAAEKKSRHEAAARFVISRKPKPTKSLVLIHFPARNMTLSYYNDQFDLHCGDLVFVDGKLEGFRGHVVDVCYTFKINLSDYKRVISVADTKVHGEFHFAGSHFVTFDRSALPYEQVITWFKAPEKEDTEIVSEQDGSGFQLNDLQTMKISDAIAERGHDYYRENRVRYISLDKTRVRAIVEGTQPYELECDYIDGEIRNLVCDCFCTYACKHMFAAMLQLKETLTFIEKHYPGRFEESRYFAAVCKEMLLNTAMAGRETGSIVL